MTDQSTPSNDKPAIAGRGTGNLTPRLRTFAREYHLDGNGAKAATTAGYSEKSAASQIMKLLEAT